jgi:hypothetical protein
MEFGSPQVQEIEFSLLQRVCSPFSLLFVDTRGQSPGIKRPWRESTSITAVKNKLRNTSIPPAPSWRIQRHKLPYLSIYVFASTTQDLNNKKIKNIGTFRPIKCPQGTEERCGTSRAWFSQRHITASRP